MGIDSELDQLKVDGLLSPVIDGWRELYLDQFTEWFTYCRELNRTAVQCWNAHWTTGGGMLTNDALPTATRIFGRALNNYAACVLLAERAMAIEAAAMARPILEASFWLAYIAEEPDKALSDLEADDLKNEIERHKELQRVFHDDPELTKRSQEQCALISQKLGSRDKPSIAKIAKRYGKGDGYLSYRCVSAYYGHLSRSSLRVETQSQPEGDSGG